MRKHAYIHQEGDEEAIQTYRNRFESFDNQELIGRYNDIISIFGNRQQTLYLIALHQTFLKKFAKSPFIIEGYNTISLGSKIFYLSETDSFEPIYES